MMATENLRNTMATVDAMKQANKDLRRTYGNLNIDKIERIQDEMEDLLEQSSALQETLSRSYALPDDIDEEDLEAELEALYVNVCILTYAERKSPWSRTWKSHPICKMRPRQLLLNPTLWTSYLIKKKYVYRHINNCRL